MISKSKSVCLLGFDRRQTRIANTIESRDFHLDEKSAEVDDLSKYDVVVSFGYRHIIRPNTLRTLQRPAINLHIGYLPYNRGAHPNFWSWIEGTPSGVTIHEIDEGIDTGPICFQRKVEFDGSARTFSETYAQLIDDIEDLFIHNVDELLNGTYVAIPQVGAGSYHKAGDLPEWMDTWDMTIDDAIRRYD